MWPYSGLIICVPYITSIERQFLESKSIFIDDGLERVDVSGIWRNFCVDGFFHLLHGKESEYFLRRNYEYENPELKWSKDKFDSVFNHIFDAAVIEGLTIEREMKN